MASTVLNENGFQLNRIERQFGHVQGNSVRAFHNHLINWISAGR